jgi:hypothetical protein
MTQLNTKIKTSSIYFTSTRNTKESDIINTFENKLRLGKIDDENVNIIPVLKKDYNHVFFNITWNDTEEATHFVSELISNSSIKVYHNQGYWLCRMNRNPLKLRNKKVACIKFACVTNPTEEKTLVPTSPPPLAPAPAPAPASYVTNFFDEDEFYVIN